MDGPALAFGNLSLYCGVQIFSKNIDVIVIVLWVCLGTWLNKQPLGSTFEPLRAGVRNLNPLF